MNESFTRRNLLHGAAAAAGAVAIASLSKSARAAEAAKLEKGQTILFQGDSITDAGRDRRAEGQANNQGAWGRGYPMLIGCELLRDHPELDLKIYNRGISGNKVPDLDARWEKDCVELKPALLSILIGVNDIWHKLNGRYDGTVETYEKGFDALLTRTREALPDVQFVICEPFVLRCGAINDKWFPEFDDRRAAAARVSEKHKTLWVPFQTIFDEAVAAGTPPNYWAGDGVHPSPAGHSLMGQAWRKVVGV
jgi:lysophospholipase L1-like esterase